MMIPRLIPFLSVLAVASAAPWTTKRTQPMTRRLEDEGEEEEADMSWMNGYTLLYQSCFSSDNVVTFRLCPEDYTCESGCEGGAEYAVNLNLFVDAFTEAQMDAHEYRCEMARENCEYDDDEACYEAEGLDDCEDQNEDENGFDLQEFLECNQINENYYVGPYCDEDNYSIYLGVFSDQYCTELTDSDMFYEDAGFELPYSSSPILDDECADCREHGADQDKNDGDGDDEDEVIEQCEEIYQESLKCEENLDIDDPDDSGCSYINELESGVMTSSKKSMDVKRRNILIGVLVGAAVAICCGITLCGHAYKKLGEPDSKNEGLISGNN